MFEAAELGSKIGKDEYKARVPDLRESLLRVQNDLRRRQRSRSSSCWPVSTRRGAARPPTC